MQGEKVKVGATLDRTSVSEPQDPSMRSSRLSDTSYVTKNLITLHDGDANYLVMELSEQLEPLGQSEQSDQTAQTEQTEPSERSEQTEPSERSEQTERSETTVAVRTLVPWVNADPETDEFDD